MPRLLLPYLLVFLVVLVVSSFLGSIPILPTEVWDSFVAGEATGSYHHWTDFRLQRLLFAAAVGGGLALAGTVFQAVLRNPLAEPYILGISGGASVGAVAARCLGGGAMLSTAVAGGDALAGAGALVGALLSILLLMSLAHWARLADPPSLILAGVVLNAIFGAMILLFYSLAPERLVKSSLHWLMGSIASDSYLGTTRLRDTALALFVGAALLMAVARHLDLLSLGEEEAADLGLDARRFRIIALLLASLLTAALVAAAGPIGFVGLVVPHILRRLHGPSHRRLIPLSLIGGGVFLMAADTVARTALLPHQLPVGVVTALIGGPFFLVLLAGRREGGRDVI